MIRYPLRRVCSLCTVCTVYVKYILADAIYIVYVFVCLLDVCFFSLFSLFTISSQKMRRLAVSMPNMIMNIVLSFWNLIEKLVWRWVEEANKTNARAKHTHTRNKWKFASCSESHYRKWIAKCICQRTKIEMATERYLAYALGHKFNVIGKLWESTTEMSRQFFSCRIFEILRA